MKLMWNAEEVIRALRASCLHEQSWQASGVSIDSRTVQAGDLFVALRGENYDGHDFVGEALKKGAAAALVEHAMPQLDPSARLVTVANAFDALCGLGAMARERTKATIVAVTGSVGKTTTKELVRLALDTTGEAYSSTGSMNNHWGVPLSLARLPSDAKWGVFEMGMNHEGEIASLALQVRPHVSIVTNVEAVHLENFENMNGIADAKAEIFQGMDDQGIAVLNGDNLFYGRLASAAKKQGLRHILRFGTESKMDARLVSYTPSPKGGIVEAEVLGNYLSYEIGARGRHIAFDSVGALLAAIVAGGDPVMAAENMSAFCSLERRGQTRHIFLPTGGALTLIDETYNASPAAVRAALDTLSMQPGVEKGRRIAVLGDMKELGPLSPTLHVELKDSLQRAGIDLVYCCGEHMAYLYEALPVAMRGACTKSSDGLAQIVASAVQGGDTLLIKGSKSVHMERVVEALDWLQSSETQTRAS
jgi:UDP-N-acetylmuramoyl-tripeptide--D-alanyl-D-alanine ligase